MLKSTIANARASGTAARRRRMPKQADPIAIQHEAGNALAGLFRRASESFTKRLDQLAEFAGRGDAERAGVVLDAAYREGEKYLTDAAPLIRQFAPRVADHNARELGKQFKAALGATPPMPAMKHGRARKFAESVALASRAAFRDLRDQLAKHVSLMTRQVRDDSAAGRRARRDSEFPIEHALAHVNLISGLSKAERERLAAEIAAMHATDDLTKSTLRVVLEARFDMSEDRARRIARDQVAKLNGQVNADRQIGLGVTHFRWKTRQDRKVRPLHKERRDQIYAWDDPPDGETPGMPHNCRCHADPVVDNIAALIGGTPREPGTREVPEVFRPRRVL